MNDTLNDSISHISNDVKLRYFIQKSGTVAVLMGGLNLYENLIDVKTQLHDFKNENLKFTVSSRNLGKHHSDSIITYLKLQFIYCGFHQIESVFGHTEDYSALYGGRVYNDQNAITNQQIDELEKHGIGIALTLTNHYFSEADYTDSLKLLKKYHKKTNSIICTNDDLAMRIKNEFPDYQLKASLIKNLNTHEKINKALEIYDYVVVPMDKNDDDEFLQNIVQKDRAILFGNASCAYTCPARTCYAGISLRKEEPTCSKPKIPREEKGFVFFNVAKFSNMGFNKIKLIPAQIKPSKTI